jgi:hypothetical protein
MRGNSGINFKKEKMKALILLAVLGTSTVALAEDCTCVDKEVVTDSCWEFILSEKGSRCQDSFEFEDSKRITELEKKVEQIEAGLSRRVRRLERRK